METESDLLSPEEEEDFKKFFKDMDLSKLSEKDRAYMKTFYLGEINKIGINHQHHVKNANLMSQQRKIAKQSIQAVENKKDSAVSAGVTNKDSSKVNSQLKAPQAKVDLQKINKVNAKRMKNLPSMPQGKPTIVTPPKPKKKTNNVGLQKAKASRLKNLTTTGVAAVKNSDNNSKILSTQPSVKNKKEISGTAEINDPSEISENQNNESSNHKDTGKGKSENLLVASSSSDFWAFISELSEFLDLKIFLIVLGLVLVMIKYTYAMRKRKKLKEKSLGFQDTGYEYENANLTSAESERGRILQI